MVEWESIKSIFECNSIYTDVNLQVLSEKNRWQQCILYKIENAFCQLKRQV